jgi:diaminopimelate epimerase
VRFSKWHALGNSYLVVEREDAGTLDEKRVRRLCDVASGIGADGVLEVVCVTGSLATVVIWNPDGSTAEMSGNGTRIAARWLAGRAGAGEVTIAVGEREVHARMLDELQVESNVGRVEVGALESIDPHAVVRCEEPAREVLLRLGPLIETHSRFPERTNVQLAHPESAHEVRALVWERGAGETPASGSSAVAVAAAAVTHGWAASPVTVHMPGGDLVVEFEDGRALLVGPAELICEGETAL